MEAARLSRFFCSPALKNGAMKSTTRLKAAKIGAITKR
jgi:hypothetical protein